MIDWGTLACTSSPIVTASGSSTHDSMDHLASTPNHIIIRSSRTALMGTLSIIDSQRFRATIINVVSGGLERVLVQTPAAQRGFAHE
jgi:hypothetical protein